MKYAERQRFSIIGDRGIDLSHDPRDVLSGRAVYLRNLICRNGSNQKRNGWEQIIHKPGKINGFWKTELADRSLYVLYAGKKFYVAEHIEGPYTDLTASSSVEKNKLDSNILTETETIMYKGQGRLYFVGCGDYIVFGEYDGAYEFRRVYDDEKTFVPTTTMNGTCKGTVKNIELATLDEVNLLSPWRKNSFWLAEDDNVFGQADKEFWLDTREELDPSQPIEVKIIHKKGVISEEHILHAEESEDTQDPYWRNLNPGDETPIVMEVIEAVDTQTVSAKVMGGSIPSWKKSHYSSGDANTNDIEPVFTKQGSTDKVYIKFEETSPLPSGYKFYSKGYLWSDFPIKYKTDEQSTYAELLPNTKGPQVIKVSVEDKWYATAKTVYYGFEVRVEGVSVDKITNGGKAGCIASRIETRDGAGLPQLVDEDDNVWGEYDYLNARIFLSPMTKNEDEEITSVNKISTDQLDDNIFVKFRYEPENRARIISKCSIGCLFGVGGNSDRLFVSGNPEFPNMDWHSAQDDFSYFSDWDSAAMGTTDTAINGYQRLSDDTLAIFKEHSPTDPSLFIRTGVFEKVNDDDGFERAMFPIKGSFVGEGLHAKKGVVSFNGEPLVVAENGVFAITTSANVVSEERYTRERGLPINIALRGNSLLKEAKAIVYQGKYCLAVGDTVYIADSLYSFDDKGNYEWWIWDNTPVNVWAVIDGSLCFGTADGRVCMFKEEHFDRKKDAQTITTQVFEAVSSPLTPMSIEFAKASGLEISDLSDEFVFDSAVYSLLARANDNLYDITYTAAKITIKRKQDGEGYGAYLPYVEEGLPVKIGGNSAFIKDYEHIDSITLDIYFRYENNNDYTISGTPDIFIVQTGRSLYVKEKDDNMEFYSDSHGEQPLRLNALTYTGTYYANKPVVAEWISPVYNMGASDFSKTLLYINITADGTKLQWGYETRSTEKMLDMRGQGIFSFADWDFGQFTFSTGFQNSYTKKIKERAFNYIQLKYRDDSGHGCNVSGFIVGYKTNHLNKGVN